MGRGEGQRLTKKVLRQEYERKKDEIQRRLKEFESIGKKKTTEERFIELCFCICTPQSNAKKVAQAVNKDNLHKLMTLNQQVMATHLRANCRFHNNKARYIVEARSFIPQLRQLPADPMDARALLVKNIKGLGYKEASHFLRNVGYRKLCIIDRHVVNLLCELEVFSTNDMPKSPRQYLSMEEQIKRFASEVDIDVDELDLLLWSIRSGFVFR